MHRRHQFSSAIADRRTPATTARRRSRVKSSPSVEAHGVAAGLFYRLG